MLKMVRFMCLFYLLFLSILGLTGAGQESIAFLNLHDTTQELMSATELPIGVSVGAEELNEVSGSVLKAESWVKTNVLAHYPAAQITTIVVGENVLCQKDQEHNLGLVLPAMKNVYHSLVRWGLQREIKVSAAFSPSCLRPVDGLYKADLVEKVIKPVLQFLEITNSTYSVNPPVKVSPLSDGFASLVSSHSESIKKLGFLELMKKINVLVSSSTPKVKKPIIRKLSSMDSKVTFPQRPTPLVGDSTPQTPPIHSSIGFSVPANVAKQPLPPLAQVASPPPTFTFPFAPEMPPAASPHGYNLPPCNPVDGSAPPPEMGYGVVQKLWCVAKPSVPPETLQEAMDYACGEGGGDCEEIGPYGNCYHPDTVVAHASYAFNSYWQKNKRNGGTCNFGGTAMLINADPSFLLCRFILS